MTIAAAFKCSNGIVLCADTEETVGQYLKRAQPKIATIPQNAKEGERVNAVVAAAGDSSFVDLVIDRIGARIQQCSDPTHDNLKDIVDEVLTKIYLKYWPLYPAKGRPEAHLLMALNTSDRGQVLFHIDGPIMVVRSDYDCVGVGLLLAKYLADKFYRSDGDYRRGILLSIYLLEEVKRSVQFCGGESHVVLLNDDGRIMHVPDIFIRDAASVFNQASGTFNRLLMHALDLEKHERELIEGFAQYHDVDLPQLVAFMKEFDSGVKKITTQKQRSASQGTSS